VDDEELVPEWVGDPYSGSPTNASKLIDFLNGAFDDDEEGERQFCRRFGVDWNSLEGSSRKLKTSSLVGLCFKRGMLPKLARWLGWREGRTASDEVRPEEVQGYKSLGRVGLQKLLSQHREGFGDLLARSAKFIDERNIPEDLRRATQAKRLVICEIEAAIRELDRESTARDGKYSVSIGGNVTGSAIAVGPGAQAIVTGSGGVVAGGNVFARNVTTGIGELHSAPPTTPGSGAITISGVRNDDVNAQGRDVVISGGIVNGDILNASNVYLRKGVVNGAVHCRWFHHEGGIINGDVRESG
jgi:hypothetical protein